MKHLSDDGLEPAARGARDNRDPGTGALKLHTDGQFRLWATKPAWGFISKLGF